MATPTLKALNRSLQSGDHLIGVMQPGISEVLRGSSFFTHQLLYSKRKIRDRLKLAVQLRRFKPTTVVLLANSLWTAVAARLSGAKRTLGYARDGRGWLLSEPLPALKREDGKFAAVPAIDYYLQLAQRLGCAIDDRRMELLSNAKIANWLTICTRASVFRATGPQSLSIRAASGVRPRSGLPTMSNNWLGEL